MPGVVGVFTAESTRPGARRLAVQPDGRAHAAGERQGALRRRAGRRRRRRDRRPGHRRRRDGVRRHRLPADTGRHRSRGDVRDPDLRSRRLERRVRHHRARHAREHRRRRLLRRLRGHRHRPLRQPARRPCPLEVRGSAATWVDGRLYQWLSTQHAQGTKASIAAVNGVDGDEVRVITPDVGGGFGAKIGTYPEELLLGPISKAHRPARAVARDPQRVDDGARPRPQPRCSTSPSAAPATARSRTTSCMLLQDCRRLRRHRRGPRAIHDPADGVGRVRHPQHRGAHHVGRHEHHADRRRTAVPGGPRRRPRSSGPWTCSPPRSARTPPRCAG